MSRFSGVVLLALVGLSLTALAASGQDNRYSDDDGSVHEPALTVLGAEGILEGTDCDTGKICPNDPIDRWTVAVWLVRAGEFLSSVHYSTEYHERNPVTVSQFADVDADDWRAPYVERLAEDGITTGCKSEPARFCPDQQVKRGQMATFLTRAFGLEAATPAGFADTDESAHAANIDALAAAGITQGCATDPLRFCPGQSVTRGQMASFLARTMKLELPPRNPGDSVDCDDFDTQGSAQVYFDTYYSHYGDVAMLDDGGRLRVACERLPTPWYYWRNSDTTPYIATEGRRDGASSSESLPYLGLNCIGGYVNVNQNFSDRVSVEFQVAPASSLTEWWDVGQQGSNTFLLPPQQTSLWEELATDEAEELVFRVNGKTYRFDATGYKPAAGWLTTQC